MVRTLWTFLGACGWVLCQQISAPTEQPTAAPVVTLDVVTLDVAPLAPPDLASPYASPRDAARHRFQVTLAKLQSDRNIGAALQGFGDAFATDRTYAAAAFDLGIVAALAGKWQDALAALEEAARLDPAGLGKLAAPSIERLRKVCTLEATPEGRLERRYDEALYPVLQKLPTLQPADAMRAVAEAGRIDPKRWEAPALLGSLNGNGYGYDVAAKFLEIAVANARDPQVKGRLEKALEAARRELRYDAARATADAAADRGEYEKAGALYENAWAAMPARSSNGMEAASAWLLHDDTARASTLLIRLRESADPELAPLATAMLSQLEPIEPGAKASASGAPEFFRDAGSTQPVFLFALIPPVNTTTMELLFRPLPKLIQDPEPVVLLAALSANPGDAASASLPELPAPKILGENPWREVLQLAPSNQPADASSSPRQERPTGTADISNGARIHRSIQVKSQPAGASIFIGETTGPVCETPCSIQAPAGSHTVRVSLPGYREESREVRVAANTAALDFSLTLIRGSVVVDAPAAALKVNGTAVTNQPPVELSLIPGLYRITAEFGATVRERMLSVKPGARLRLELRP